MILSCITRDEKQRLDPVAWILFFYYQLWITDMKKALLSSPELNLETARKFGLLESEFILVLRFIELNGNLMAAARATQKEIDFLKNRDIRTVQRMIDRPHVQSYLAHVAESWKEQAGLTLESVLKFISRVLHIDPMVLISEDVTGRKYFDLQKYNRMNLADRPMIKSVSIRDGEVSKLEFYDKLDAIKLLNVLTGLNVETSISSVRAAGLSVYDPASLQSQDTDEKRGEELATRLRQYQLDSSLDVQNILEIEIEPDSVSESGS